MELYAIRYGTSSFPEKNIFEDMRQSKEKVDILWLFYLAKYNDKVILFDTGFREKENQKKWGVDLKNYKVELEQIAGGFGRVDVVFITHSHFDHIGNLDLCKNALTIISEKEYEIAEQNNSRFIRKSLPRDNNIIKVEDEYLYDNKFLYTVIGGHSKGSSVIYFTENNTTYVIAGDECYVCDNMLQERPIGICANYDKNKEFLKSNHEAGIIPLPMHDVKIFEKYNRISENMVRIL